MVLFKMDKQLYIKLKINGECYDENLLCVHEGVCIVCACSKASLNVHP